MAVEPGNFHSIDPHLSGIRLEESDHVLQQHALAFTASTDDRRELPFRDDEINAPQDRLTSQRLRHTHELQHDYNSNDVRK